MVTGVATGSDMTLDLNGEFQLNAFKGEEFTDGNVWIKKSHDPIFTPFNKTHYANKVICCVRNPYDTIASCF